MWWVIWVEGCLRPLGFEGSGLNAYPYPQRTHSFTAFGPKDPIIQGFWAILMLTVRVYRVLRIRVVG